MFLQDHWSWCKEDFCYYSYICRFLYLQPDIPSRSQKEGSESEQFWDLLGGKAEHSSQKVGSNVESDPHLFLCSYSTGYKNYLFVQRQSTFPILLHTLICTGWCILLFQSYWLLLKFLSVFRFEGEPFAHICSIYFWTAYVVWPPLCATMLVLPTLKKHLYMKQGSHDSTEIH